MVDFAALSRREHAAASIIPFPDPTIPALPLARLRPYQPKPDHRFYRPADNTYCALGLYLAVVHEVTDVALANTGFVEDLVATYHYDLPPELLDRHFAIDVMTLSDEHRTSEDDERTRLHPDHIPSLIRARFLTQGLPFRWSY